MPVRALFGRLDYYDDNKLRDNLFHSDGVGLISHEVVELEVTFRAW